MTKEDVEIFIKLLKGEFDENTNYLPLDYLPEIAKQYALTFFDIVVNNDKTCEHDNLPIILSLFIFAQFSYSQGSICLSLSHSGLSDIKKKMFQFCIKDEKKYLHSENLNSLNIDDIEKNFYNFWDVYLPNNYDFISLFNEYPKLTTVIETNTKDITTTKTPLVCYKNDNENILYFARSFYYESVIVNSISQLANIGDGIVLNYLANKDYKAKSFSDLSDDSKSKIYQKISSYLKICFPSKEEPYIKEFDFNNQKICFNSKNKSNVLEFFNNFHKNDSKNKDFYNYVLQTDKEQINKLLLNLKNDANFIDWQEVAVAMSCLSNFSVITGGPGTGKTTTVIKLLFLLISLLFDSDLRFTMAAPTGKAASRMKESITNNLMTDNIQTIKNNLIQKIFEEKNKFSDISISKDDIEIKFNNLTPRESFTVHKLLGINPKTNIPKYNKDNKLPYNIIIIDEASMVDINIFSRLLSAVASNTKIVFLGDKDQLPSVDVGSVLGDICQTFIGSYENKYNYNYNSRYFINAFSMLKSITCNDLIDLFPSCCSGNVSKLFISYRFNQQIGIGELSNEINIEKDINKKKYLKEPYNSSVMIDDLTNKVVDSKNNIKRDRLEELSLNYIVEHSLKKNDKDSPSDYNYQSYIENLKNIFLNKNSNGIINLTDPSNKTLTDELFKNFNKFRILCGVRKSNLGIEILNREIEKKYIKILKEIENKNKIILRVRTPDDEWYLGKPVMINTNNYTLNLVNGDIGITVLEPSNQMNSGRPGLKVLFQMPDGNYKYFNPSELSNYELAFAMTIHKSQGSEFDHTLMVLPLEQSLFVTKELLYTGITRAKKFITIIDPNNNIEKFSKQKVSRKSNLSDRLIEVFKLR